MPARLIRDDLLESERVQSLPVEARWLYVSILLSSDDVGLFEVSHFKLARKSGMEQAKLPMLLQLLGDSDLVRFYEDAGKRFGFVPRFGQRLQIKRAKYPLPPLSLVADDEDASKKIKHLARVPTVDSGEPRGSTVDPRLNLNQNLNPQEQHTHTALPRDWALPKSWGQWAQKKNPGWTVDQVRDVAERFAAHHWSAGTLSADWPSAWTLWVTDPLTLKALPAAAAAPTGAPTAPASPTVPSKAAAATQALLAADAAAQAESQSASSFAKKAEALAKLGKVPAGSKA